MNPASSNNHLPIIWAETDGTISAKFNQETLLTHLTPLSLFPLSEGKKNIVLLDQNQNEVFLIDDLANLEPTLADAITVALLKNRFILKLLKIKKVSSLRTPSEWQVISDRGESNLIFVSEEAIRRLPDDCALIQDSQGLRYLITSIRGLDNYSRKVIEYYI